MAEPFTTTLTVSAYFAIVLALPVIIYQAYAYVLPAFSARREEGARCRSCCWRRSCSSAGVVFAYFVVMPPAIDFLLNFNDERVQHPAASARLLHASSRSPDPLGLIFQIPLAILAVTRLGIVTPEQLAANRRYAILVIAVVADAAAQHRPGRC